MSVMDMFRSMVGGGQPASLPANQQQQNPNVNPNAQQPANVQLPNQQQPNNQGADPSNPNFGQAEPKEPKSPLADFEGLWNSDPKKDAPQVSLGDFAFNVDRTKITQAAKGMDFTKAVTPEVMEAIKAGGDGAMAAMLTAMNTMSQEVMQNAILVSAGIVEGGIKSAGANTEKLLPSLVRKSNISNALREDNPLWSNPATAPMLSMLESQLARKFPNATPAEITENAKKYIEGFVKEAGGVVQSNDQQQGGQKKEPSITDFSSWEI